MTNREADMKKYGVTLDGSAAPGTKGLLTRLDEQRRLIVRRAMMPKPCPYCHTPVDLYAGHPEFRVAAEDRIHDDEFSCPNCRHRLSLVVPFVGQDCWSLIVVDGKPLTIDDPLPPKAHPPKAKK
jgi:hypothetical protein